MIEPHHTATLGTVASSGLTLGTLSMGSDWRVVAINALITLASGALSAYLKSRKDKGVKK